MPVELRRAIGEMLDSPVKRGTRVWGSYGPGPTFRLVLEDDRRAFVKAISPDSSETQRKMFAHELRVYQELGHLIAGRAPDFQGQVVQDRWHAMILEDLGPKSAPPWSRVDAKRVVQGLAELHDSTTDIKLPQWTSTIGADSELLATSMWQRSADYEGLEGLANLSTEPRSAISWLRTYTPVLAEASSSLTRIRPGNSLLHMDVRSDNLRVVNGRLRLFDWASAIKGPHELDVVAFAQTVEAEGYFDSESVLGWYEKHKRLDHELTTASLVVVAGYFASRAWLPDISGLPRLRTWQRAQLKVSLSWAAIRLGLPAPDWLAKIAV